MYMHNGSYWMVRFVVTCTGCSVSVDQKGWLERIVASEYHIDVLATDNHKRNVEMDSFIIVQSGYVLQDIYLLEDCMTRN